MPSKFLECNNNYHMPLRNDQNPLCDDLMLVTGLLAAFSRGLQLNIFQSSTPAAHYIFRVNRLD
jgi:hypothetical protein